MDSLGKIHHARFPLQRIHHLLHLRYIVLGVLEPGPLVHDWAPGSITPMEVQLARHKLYREHEARAQ